MKKINKTVCVIGIWHLGGTNAVGFGQLGYKVIGLDFDSEKVAKLNKGKAPLHEPGLEEGIKSLLRAKRLDFSDRAERASEADFVVVAYDSPVNERDEVDVSSIVSAAEKIAKYLGPDVPLIITSQLPLGTSEKIESRIRELNSSWRSGVVYTPENLRLGNSIALFLSPDMLVLGSNSPDALREALELYKPIKTEKVEMDLRSAEMVKHALNTFLATSITFINEIANLSDRLGADAVKVGGALKLDKRIGLRALLSPGLGFSGGTLARDVTQLKAFAAQFNYEAPLLQSIMKVNEGTFDQVIWRLKDKLGDLKGKRIGILGLTYKAGTSTVRRSPALKIIQKIEDQGAECFGYDPMASEEELVESKLKIKRVLKSSDLAKNSDALVLVTEWPEFRDLPFSKMAKNMKRSLMIDTKNYLDPQLVSDGGFEYLGFGRTFKNSTGKTTKKKLKQ